MCDECGCGESPPRRKIELNLSVSEKNDRIAGETSSALKRKGILCINLLGAPGSGKTAVIEGIAKHIPVSEIAVIEGDLESSLDKERLEAGGLASYQINTHSGCHLNAEMVMDAVGRIDLSGKKYLIIENVGNLVCPAGVMIGQHMDIVVSSTTEGSDKPAKYPIVFMDAAAIIISKIDLARNVDFKEKDYLKEITRINPRAPIMRTEMGKPGSFENLAGFLIHERKHVLGREHSH